MTDDESETGNFSVTALNLTPVLEETAGNRDDGKARTAEVLAASGTADIPYSLKNNRLFSDHLENSDGSLCAPTRQKKANCRVLIFYLRDTIYNENKK